MIDDSFWHYLPRNLSYCNVCVEASAQHIQKKIRLLKKNIADISDPSLQKSTNKIMDKFPSKDSPTLSNTSVILPPSNKMQATNELLSLTKLSLDEFNKESRSYRNQDHEADNETFEQGSEVNYPLHRHEQDEVEDKSNLLSSSLNLPKENSLSVVQGHSWACSPKSIECLFTDSEFEDVRPEMRRATSLKTAKTPPGTPRRKKMVRFADALGLDLEMVRQIMSTDLPPNIPLLQDPTAELPEHTICKYLACNFPQPGIALNFFDRLRVEKVVLENTIITDLTVTGIVRVLNLAFNKRVSVRFTINKWQTTHEVPATYVHGSNDGFSDKFSFTIFAPIGLEVGHQLDLAVCYYTSGKEFWDNNHGCNYTFDCCVRTVAAASFNRGWYHFM